MLLTLGVDSEALRERLTFRPRGPTAEGEVHAYTSTQYGLLVPRFAESSKDDVSTCLPAPASFAGELRPYQRAVAQRVYGDLTTHGCALAYLYTGWGKTAMALFVVAALGKSTIVYVHKRTLHAQWQEAAQQFLPGVALDVRTVQYQLHHLDEMREFDETLVIFDECHHFAARAFSRLMHHSRAKYHLALSASEHRADGLEDMLLAFFGRPTVVQTQLQVVPDVFVAKFDGAPELYNVGSILVKGRSMVNMNALLSNLVESDARNAFIVGVLKRLEGRCVLVLTKRRGHAFRLVELCQQNMRCEVRLLLGGMKRDAIAAAKISAEQVVLVGTTQAAGEGFDMACLDTLVFALPCSSVQQEVGRILRRKGARTPWVVDILDGTGVLRAQYAKRRQYYASQQLHIRDF